MPSISPAKLAANRANAQRSTGPRTPEGKRRSARNALTHGLSSQVPAPSPVLPNEDPALFSSFRTALLDNLAPQSPLELELADRIVSLHWRLRRCPAIEAELANRHVERRRQAHDAQQAARYNCKPKDRLPFTPPPPVQFLANQFDACDDRSNPLARLQRYETALDRTLRRCLADYRTLQLTRLANEELDDPTADDATEDVSQQDALPNEPTTETTRGTGDPPVSAPASQNEQNEPNLPQARDAGVSPALPNSELPNEPTAPVPSDHNGASAPSAPLRLNLIPELQNEPNSPTTPSSPPLPPPSTMMSPP